MNGLSDNNHNQKINIKKSSIQEFGVFSQVEFARGNKIGYFEGYPVRNNTRHSLIFNGVKIEPTGLLKYLNHSCSPNSCFRDRILIAKRNIKPNEEITIDYFATEKRITFNFKCNCGSSNCKRNVL